MPLAYEKPMPADFKLYGGTAPHFVGGRRDGSPDYWWLFYACGWRAGRFGNWAWWWNLNKNTVQWHDLEKFTDGRGSIQVWDGRAFLVSTVTVDGRVQLWTESVPGFTPKQADK